MSIFFSAGEVLDAAMGIEKNGAAFYEEMSRKTQNKDIKAIYEYLVSEEKKHFTTFYGILRKIFAAKQLFGLGVLVVSILFAADDDLKSVCCVPVRIKRHNVRTREAHDPSTDLIHDSLMR